jgi:DNA-binding MarR family transcriptional regulator
MPVKAPLFPGVPGGGPGRGGAGSAPEPPAVEAVRALTRASRVMERASGGLSLALYRVLSAVAAGDERASRVAERLALGKPTVSASVDALCSRGFLIRSVVASDQRAVQLSLTESGRDLLVEVEVAMTADLEALAARTGRRDDVISALVALGAAIDESVAERRR